MAWHWMTTVGLVALAGAVPVDSQQQGARREQYDVLVEAGGRERREVITTFVLPNPPRSKAEHWILTDANGGVLPVDVESTGRATFILRQLAKNSTQHFILRPSPQSGASSARIEARKEGAKLRFSRQGQTILEYQGEPGALPRPQIKPVYRRGGYLHPLITPLGKLVTDDFATNHVHHHGVWFAWTKTEFEGRKPDFWNMGEGTGTVEFKQMPAWWSGSVAGGFRAKHQFVDLTSDPPKGVLDEEWEVLVYNSIAPTEGGPSSVAAKRGTSVKATSGRAASRMSGRFTFDLISTQTCASASPLVLPKYHYGGLGFRGNAAWNGKNNTFFLTSEGETNRIKGNESVSRWCYIGGLVEGQLAGIVLLCHPQNFRGPQPMRLHPTEPFFCYAPSQGGDWEITPGGPYISRYRVLIMDGAPEKAGIDEAWDNYAYPPKVTCRELR